MTRKQRSYDTTATSAAPPSAVYGLLVDGSTWPSWSPVDSFESEPVAGRGGPDDRPIDPLEEVRVFRSGRNVARERIVELVPDRLVVYDIVRENFGVMRGFRARIELEDDGHGGTRIRWRATWDTPFPLGWIVERYTRAFQLGMTDGLARGAEQV